MIVKAKEYCFSLNDSEIRVIKRALELALLISQNYFDEEKCCNFVDNLRELFNDEDGNASASYGCVVEFRRML